MWVKDNDLVIGLFVLILAPYAKGHYSQDIMQNFSEAENMSDMEWAKIMVKGVIEESIVDAKEDCSFLCFGGPREES